MNAKDSKNAKEMRERESALRLAISRSCSFPFSRPRLQGGADDLARGMESAEARTTVPRVLPAARNDKSRDAPGKRGG